MTNHSQYRGRQLACLVQYVDQVLQAVSSRVKMYALLALKGAREIFETGSSHPRCLQP